MIIIAFYLMGKDTLQSAEKRESPEKPYLMKSNVINVRMGKDGLEMYVQKTNSQHPSKPSQQEFPGGKGDIDDIYESFTDGTDENFDQKYEMACKICAMRENMEETGIKILSPDHLIPLRTTRRKFLDEHKDEDYDGIEESWYINYVPSNASITLPSGEDIHRDYLESGEWVPIGENSRYVALRNVIESQNFCIGRDDECYKAEVITNLISEIREVIHSTSFLEAQKRVDTAHLSGYIASGQADITDGFSMRLSNGEKVSGIADTIYEICDLNKQERKILLTTFFSTKYVKKEEIEKNKKVDRNSGSLENLKNFFENNYYKKDLQQTLQEFLPDFSQKKSTLLRDALSISSLEDLLAFTNNANTYGEDKYLVPEILSSMLKLKIIWDKGFMKERKKLKSDFDASVAQLITTEKISHLYKKENKLKDLPRIIAKLERKENEQGDIDDYCQLRIFLENTADLQDESTTILKVLNGNDDYDLYFDGDTGSGNASAGERHEVKLIGTFKGQPIEVQIATKAGFQKSETRQFFHSFYSEVLQKANLNTRLFIRSEGRYPLLREDEMEEIIEAALQNPAAYPSGGVNNNEMPEIRHKMWERIVHMGLWLDTEKDIPEKDIPEKKSSIFLDLYHFLRLFPRIIHTDFIEEIFPQVVDQLNAQTGLQLATEKWKELLVNPEIFARNNADLDPEVVLEKLAILLLFHISGEPDFLHQKIRNSIGARYVRIKARKNAYKKLTKKIEEEEVSDIYKQKMQTAIDSIEEQFGIGTPVTGDGDVRNLGVISLVPGE